MKLGTVEFNSKSALAVAVSDSHAVVLPQFASVDEVLATGDPVEMLIASAVGGNERLDVDTLTWLPPVLRPGKVLCVALNNSANPDRIISGPDTPAMFVKPASALVGHGRPVIMKPAYGRVHPEPELAVVIGRAGADIPVDDAAAHVFGYTIFNDLTSPSMRETDTFHYRAIHPDPTADDGIRFVESWVSYPARYKGSDTFGPIGPWVTTADEIADPHALRITCRHDGRLITDDNTANLRFSVAQVISFASSYLTLEVGDIIAMGTALKRSSGGGAVQNLDLNALGGVVEVEIERIGKLSNPVKHREAC
jgi:2-keto-4-pentenoate hydratase/2-oxohepta-3-ene-1,7-dioic acid hydratase in catechol pathway